MSDKIEELANTYIIFFFGWGESLRAPRLNRLKEVLFMLYLLGVTIDLCCHLHSRLLRNPECGKRQRRC